MSNPITPSPVSGDQQPEPVNVTPGFEETLRVFWEKNGKTVVILCAVVLLAIVARGAWGIIAAQRENAIAEAYGQATTSDKLKAFAAANDGHALAGAAYLRLADEAVQASKYADAIGFYEKAAASLKDPMFAGRIQLGLAMSRLNSGQAAQAEPALKTLANDTTQLKAVRAEAAYHLGLLASEAGRSDEATKYADQVMSIDSDSIWTQRAMMLRARVPVAASAAPAVSVTPATSATPAPAADAVPSVSFKGSGSK